MTTAADLERELAAAAALARDPRCAGALAHLRIDEATWGLGFVDMGGTSYGPSEAGEPAFIFAAEHAGELVDLVACRLCDRAVAARLGIAPALGLDWIDIAANHGRRLLLYADPLAWAAGGFCGSVVIDWRQARSLLGAVPNIACASQALAHRVHAALTAPLHLPDISYARRAA